MSSITELSQKAEFLRNVMLSREDSDISAHAEELLSFLNILQDLLHKNPKIWNLPHVDDIACGLESDPEETLRNENIRKRLIEILNTFG